MHHSGFICTSVPVHLRVLLSSASSSFRSKVENTRVPAGFTRTHSREKTICGSFRLARMTDIVRLEDGHESALQRTLGNVQGETGRGSGFSGSDGALVCVWCVVVPARLAKYTRRRGPGNAM